MEYKVKRKIIHVVESTATGTLSMLSVLANAQIREGHEVSVIYSTRKETPDDLSQYFDSSISLIKVNMNGIASKLSALFKIRTLVSSISPDNVFLHSSFAGFIGRVSLLGKAVKPFYLPHCISFMRQDIGNFKKLLFIAFEWLAALKTSVYVACSASEQKQIKKLIPFRKCELVENAIEVEKWMLDSDIRDREKVVITVGQIREQKGPIEFAEIAKLSSQLGYDFVWVGDGECDETKSSLANAGVKILGWKNKSEIKALLSNAQVFLSTSKWEGLPVAPLEAMLCGCTAVLSDCFGNRDIIKNRENGLLFSGVEEGAAALRDLTNDKELMSKFAEVGKSNVMNNYNLTRYAEEFNELLSKS